MATWGWGYDETFTADVDLSASQYQFVRHASTAGNVELSSTVAGSALGVLQNDPKAGEAATVRLLGLTKVSANTEAAASTLTLGGWIKSGSDGRAVGSKNWAASSYQLGYSLTALSSGCGVTVSVILTGPRRLAG